MNLKKGEKCLKKNLDDEFLKQFFWQILKGSLEDVFIHTRTQKRNEKHTKITFFLSLNIKENLDFLVYRRTNFNFNFQSNFSYKYGGPNIIMLCL